MKNFDVLTVETCSVSPPLVPLADYLIDRNTLLACAYHVGMDIGLKLIPELGLICVESLSQIIERHGDSKCSEPYRDGG
jgi:hypothetical protein